MTTKTKQTHYTITDIRRINREKGLHFFDLDAMRFFSSRVLPNVYQGPGGVYFITSEQFEPGAERRYTVRQFHPATGRVDTAGAFYAMNEHDAKERARALAKG